MDNFNFAQQGWQCPICKRVYSPFTPMCYCCGGESKMSTSTTVNAEANLDCWDNNPTLLASNPPKLVWKCRYCGKEITTEVTEMPTAVCDCLAKDKRTCDYCKYHNKDYGETLHCACRDCINFNRWEKIDA